MKRASFVCLTALSLFSLSAANANIQSQNNEDGELLKFLISKGILIHSKNSEQVPLSYYTGNQNDIDSYFGDYICKLEESCEVVDSLYDEPYAILGHGMPFKEGMELEKKQAQAQIERTDMKYGTDIYDAATWQIALALAAKKGLIETPKAKALIDNQTHAILQPDNRAINPVFSYGYFKPITDPKLAFAYRMIATDFHNKDPFYQGRYQHALQWDYDPQTLSKSDPEHHSADFFKYVTTWSDWKPITGENAWAQLIGPLQADYLLSEDGRLPADTPSLVNAMNSLYAFSAMQAGIGGLYYAPGGSLGNQGTISKGEISIENNFSVLAGLQILNKILEETEQTAEVKNALKQIDVLLHGGITVNGYKTIGLLSFIYNGAFDAKRGIFYTHGIAADPSSTNDWEPDTSDNAAAMAIDINTWGISSLSPETIDQWYGEGSALTMWKKVKEKGGYFSQDGRLWGVGFTLQNDTQRIMSAEWTAGAINALESLIAYYEQKGEDCSVLKADLLSMQEGIKHLRNDRYLQAGFDEATPATHFVTIAANLGQAYLYASKRFAIPFGWNANPLPSTTSTAWILMNHSQYNPFQFQGKLSGEKYPCPEKIDISGNKPPQGKTLPRALAEHLK